MSNFAYRLKSLREKEGLRADDLARMVGISRRIIFNYEKNEASPTLDKFIRLADFFCVSLDYLAGRSDEPHEEKFLPIAEEEYLRDTPEYFRNLYTEIKRTQYDNKITVNLFCRLDKRRQEAKEIGDDFEAYYKYQCKKFNDNRARLENDSWLKVIFQDLCEKFLK